LESGLLAARNGVLVVSPSSVSRLWVQQEYAVLVERAWGMLVDGFRPDR
jgi:hypothetical protein